MLQRAYQRHAKGSQGEMPVASPLTRSYVGVAQTYNQTIRMETKWMSGVYPPGPRRTADAGAAVQEVVAKWASMGQ